MPTWGHPTVNDDSQRLGKGLLMPEKENQEKTFTQDELNAIVADRLARERSKYADYDELKTKAEAFDKAAEESKSELEKAKERIAALEGERDARNKRDEHAALVRKVANDMKVDAKYVQLLTAETEEALVEQAKLIGERFAEPVPSESAKPPIVGKPNDEREFARRLFGDAQ